MGKNFNDDVFVEDDDVMMIVNKQIPISISILRGEYL